MRIHARTVTHRSPPCRAGIGCCWRG